MDQSTQLENLRGIVLRTLAELGMSDAEWSLVNQTALLRDRDHPGRRFEFEGIRAIWFADRSTIDFFSEDGSFLTSTAVPQPAVAQPQAA